MAANINHEYDLLDHIPMGIFLLKQDYTVLFWNTCLEEWTHIERQYILNEPIDRFFPKLALNKYSSRLAELFMGGPPIIFSCQLHHHIIPCPLDKHSLRTQHTVVTPIPTDTPKQFHALFSIQDMTDTQAQIANFKQMRDKAIIEVEAHKNTQQALHIALAEADTAHRAKDLFLANISHELRTPLNIIIGYSELLQEQAIDQGNVKAEQDDIKKILYAGKQLRELVDNLLNIVKIEAGKTEITLKTCSLQELISTLVDTIQPLAKKHNNTISLHCDNNITPVRLDNIKIHQILLNICTNACKFTENGNIHISLQQQTINNRDWAIFTIQDSGIGIDPKELNNLFNVFTQSDQLAKNRYGGTGIGLALSQQFCKLLGGKISVTSNLGEGATFTVKLPLHQTSERLN